MLLFLGGMAFSSCFFSIIAIPFSRIPLSMDAIMLSVLYPVDFFLGSVAFLFSFICHSLVLQSSFKLRKDNSIKALVGLFLYFLPIILISYSLKMVILLFSFSILYQVAFLRTSRKKRKQSNWKKSFEVE